MSNLIFRSISDKQTGLLRAIMTKIYQDATENGDTDLAKASKVVFNIITVEHIPCHTMYLHLDYVVKIIDYLNEYNNRFEENLDLTLDESELKKQIEANQVYLECHDTVRAVFNAISELENPPKPIDL